ncbi:hypothetical protein [Candidatus Absconditicoccus praedator]|uniref:hypothetical protein n=1 Tax=Candidatus Absconditicoccus praedator TaxID=2735562 RepID=UPI001E4C7881|nr:hypothetical protein [Candidatus Absconditicoccus praedator]UFX82525.1 hypothetical protein HLG78_00020 [Candidatus Absconditicoccus praedator]
MQTFVISCKNNSRQIKRFIQATLKKGLANNIKRINYAKSYSLNNEGQVIKQEEKILIIYAQKENEQEILKLGESIIKEKLDLIVKKENE